MTTITFLTDFRPVFTNPKSIQASVVLLDSMGVILEKSSEEDMRNLISEKQSNVYDMHIK